MKEILIPQLERKNIKTRQVHLIEGHASLIEGQTAINQITDQVKRALNRKELQYILIDDAVDIPNIVDLLKMGMARQNIVFYLTINVSQRDELISKIANFGQVWIHTLQDVPDTNQIGEIIKTEAKKNDGNTLAISYTHYRQIENHFLHKTKKEILKSLSRDVFISALRQVILIKNRDAAYSLITLLATKAGQELSINDMQKFLYREYSINSSDDTLGKYIQIWLKNRLIGRLQVYNTQSHRYVEGSSSFYLFDTGFLLANAKDGSLTKAMVFETLFYNNAIEQGYELARGDVPCLVYDERKKRVRGHRTIDFIISSLNGNMTGLSFASTNGEAKEKLRSLASVKELNQRYLVILDPTIEITVKKSISIIHERDILINLEDFSAMFG